jgi:hypothetical protein
MRSWLLLIALMVLNTVDLLTSYYAVHVKGNVELNPIFNALLSSAGWLWAYIYKVVLPWSILFLFIVYGVEQPVFRRVATALLYLFIYIVTNNLIVALIF